MWNPWSITQSDRWSCGEVQFCLQNTFQKSLNHIKINLTVESYPFSPNSRISALQSQGVAEPGGSRTKGWKGVRPKAEKKKVTPPIVMVEVVIGVPKGTSEGFPEVQDVF